MYICDICNKEFVSITKLNRHKNKKIPCTRNKFECYKCNKVFSCQQSLSRHRIRCKDIDDKSNDIVSNYSDYVDIYNEPCKAKNPKNIKCNYCERMFTTRQAKSVHMNYHCRYKNRKHQDDISRGYINNIKLRNYGDENMMWLGDLNNLRETSLRIGQCTSPGDLLRTCFEMMHANQKAIENRNVRIGSKKDFIDRSILEIYYNRQWNKANANDVVEKSARKLMESTSDMLVENQNLLTSGECNRYKNSMDILEEEEEMYSKERLRKLVINVLDVLLNNG